jgi:hypothetical protein
MGYKGTEVGRNHADRLRGTRGVVERFHMIFDAYAIFPLPFYQLIRRELFPGTEEGISLIHRHDMRAWVNGAQ